jgi:hypothetical protein
MSGVFGRMTPDRSISNGYTVRRSKKTGSFLPGDVESAVTVPLLVGRVSIVCEKKLDHLRIPLLTRLQQRRPSRRVSLVDAITGLQ